MDWEEDSQASRALSDAIEAGDVEAARRALDAGASLEARDPVRSSVNCSAIHLPTALSPAPAVALHRLARTQAAQPCDAAPR